MATVSTLVQDVISDIPEVPIFVATRQYLRALRILCEEARVWRVDRNLTVVEDTAERSLTSILPNDTELVDIISMKPAGGETPVTATTQAKLDINSADWRSDTALVAKNYVLESNNTLRLYPTPSQSVSNAYYLRLAVKPLLDATDIDDRLPNKYSELLIHGAKAFLFMTPRKPWTDLQLAQYHQAAFRDGIPNARAEATDEFQTGVARKVKYGGL